jgi:hypothetical protein
MLVGPLDVLPKPLCQQKNNAFFCLRFCGMFFLPLMLHLMLRVHVLFEQYTCGV